MQTLYTELRKEFKEALVNRNEGSLADSVDALSDDDIAESFSLAVDRVQSLIERGARADGNDR